MSRLFACLMVMGVGCAESGEIPRGEPIVNVEAYTLEQEGLACAYADAPNELYEPVPVGTPETYEADDTVAVVAVTCLVFCKFCAEL